MGFWEFIASVVGAIAWPVLVFVLAVRFEGAIKLLIERLRHFKAPGGVEGTFSEEIREAQEAGAVIVPPDAPIDPDASALPNDPRATEANPTGVIMESWLALESTAFRLADPMGRGGFSSPRRKGQTMDVSSLLRTNNLLAKPEEVDLYDKLRLIRNQAAHSHTLRPSPDEAEAFKSLADRLVTLWETRMHMAQPRPVTNGPVMG